MKTLETKIDKISASDPFDFQLSIRGLIYQLMEMHSNIYEYAYYFTFKRTRGSLMMLLRCQSLSRVFFWIPATG